MPTVLPGKHRRRAPLVAIKKKQWCCSKCPIDFQIVPLRSRKRNMYCKMNLMWTGARTPHGARIRKKHNGHQKPVIAPSCEQTVISVSVRSVLPVKRVILAMAQCNGQFIVGRALWRRCPDLYRTRHLRFPPHPAGPGPLTLCSASFRSVTMSSSEAAPARLTACATVSCCHSVFGMPLFCTYLGNLSLHLKTYFPGYCKVF